MTVAQRLKYARTEKGWNQARLAVAADVSPGTIGNIESGARQSKGSLPQIAKALGISHDWLALNSGEMKPKADAAPPGALPQPNLRPSSQAALLASLFDRLEDDDVLRTQVFNRASQIIIDTIQSTPAVHKPVKSSS